MRHGRTAAVGLGVAALALWAPASAAFAADATGCSGSVESRTADGTALDQASAPGEGGTANDPLVIDPAGSVAWQGSTDTVITNGTWSVKVGGVPVLSGTAENAEGRTSADGVVDLADTLAPVTWLLETNARIPVSGELTGDGGTCSGSGYIAGTGGGTFTSPVMLGGMALGALGILLGVGVAAGTKATAVAGASGATGVGTGEGGVS